MLKILLLFGVFMAGFIVLSCNSATSRNTQSKIEGDTSLQSTETLPEQDTRIEVTPLKHY